jgi:hypothetical protein
MHDALRRNRRKVLKESVVRTCKSHGGYVNMRNSLEVQALAEAIVLGLERVATIILSPEAERKAGKMASQEPALSAVDG